MPLPPEKKGRLQLHPQVATKKSKEKKAKEREATPRRPSKGSTSATTAGNYNLFDVSSSERNFYYFSRVVLTPFVIVAALWGSN